MRSRKQMALFAPLEKRMGLSSSAVEVIWGAVLVSLQFIYKLPRPGLSWGGEQLENVGRDNEGK